MLHILWVILKIILIVLGILLGLVVLALLLLLFCPVRYGAEASGSLEEWKKVQAVAFVSWLFRGIMVKIRLEEGKPVPDIRIFGIPLKKLMHKKKKQKNKQESNVSEPEQIQLPVSENRQPESFSEDTKEQKQERKDTEQTFHSKQNENAEQSMNAEQNEHAEQSMDAGQNEHAEQNVHTDQPDETDFCKEEEREAHRNPFEKIRNKISAFLEKLKKIPEFIRNFTSKVQGIYDKINNWKQFLTHPKVKDAFVFVRDRVIVLLKHIFPTKIEGHVTFGCEDPALTGTILAALGVTIPFHKNCIEINPVFEGNNLLNGDIKLRGRIYGIVLVKAAVQIYFNKNIKYVINRWKHKEESL